MPRFAHNPGSMPKIMCPDCKFYITPTEEKPGWNDYMLRQLVYDCMCGYSFLVCAFPHDEDPSLEFHKVLLPLG